MNLKAVLWTGALLAGCSFGGGGDDPYDGVIPEERFDGGSSRDASMDATVVRDATTPDATTTPDSGPRDGGGVDGGNACKPATAVAVCDPVHNTGCGLGQQCEINANGSGGKPAGFCAFYLPALGSTCTVNALTTSCTGPQACVSGTCRTPCYCDSDCASGSTCSDAAPGPAGALKLCTVN